MPRRYSLPICFLAAAVAFCSTLAAKRKPTPEPDIKALLVTGGCCHDYDNQRAIIPAAIDSNTNLTIQWTILHQRTKGSDVYLDFYKNPDWAQGYDIVVHNECFGQISDDDYVAGILKPHYDGVPAVLIHCAMHSYRSCERSEEWWRFCGAHSPRHGDMHPFEVQITAPEHEAMSGMSNWVTPNGELYFIKTTYPTMTPLAESVSDKTGESHVNIWVNRYGPNDTRVFATTIGHHNETMLDDNYMKMITRGFLWAASRSVEKTLSNKK